MAVPELVEEQLRGPAPAAPPAEIAELVDRVTTEEGELRRLLLVRAADLRGWGGRRTAERYVAELARVHACEQERLPGSTAVSEAVARGLHKLSAYKDEYEVARLHLDGLKDLPRGAKVKFHLHPPLLRALGMKRKLKLGRWFVPAFWLLARARRLRGTPLDLFGYARVRRVERRLPGEYMQLVDAGLERLVPETKEAVLEIARLPELVRGYEEIKLTGVERFWKRAEALREQLGYGGQE